MTTEYVDVDVMIKNETSFAYLVNGGGKDVMVPKEFVTEVDAQTELDVVMTIQKQFALENGLA